MECNVCQEAFNGVSNCLCTLPCSHHLCSHCLQQFININYKMCPFCSENFAANSAEDMVSHGLDNSTEYLSFQTTTSAKSPQGKSILQLEEKVTNQRKDISKASKEVCNNLQELRNQTVEMTDTINKKINIIKEPQSKKINIMKELQSSFSQQSTDPKEKIPPESQGNIIQSIETNLETPELGVPKADNEAQEIDKQGEKVTSAKRKLSFDAIVFLDEAEETKECSQKEDGRPQRKIKKASAVRKEKKGRKKKKKKKKNEVKRGASNCEVEVEDDSIHHHHPIPIMGVLDEQDNLSNGVSVMALWEMRRPLKRLVEQQRLFAVHLQEGEQRKSGKITLENNRLYLHSLKDEPKPLPNVYYLQYKEVLRLSVPSRSIFLDICAKGSPVGRIHILLNRRAPSSLPLHCTGSKGPSYINKLLEILDRGTLLEQMLCGGPPTGTGLSPGTNLDQLFSLKNDPSLIWDGKCGSVVLLDGRTSPPLLAIYIGPFATGYDLPFGQNKIGEVSDGLNVVRDAIYCLQDVKDLTISSCGVVLSTELPINEFSPL